MHYFSEKPTSAHKERLIEAILRGRKFIFKTDSGVFSPKKVDKGTKILVETLELDKKDKLLDVGCGYGVIGISVCDEVDTVVMTDINRRAVKLAKENIKINNLEDRNIEVLHSDLYEKVKDRRFTKIVSNPPIKAGKEVVHRIVREGKELLEKGGSIWLVVQRKHGAKSLAKYMEDTFDNVRTVTVKGGYRVLTSRRED
ncbi:class I SAM-dependent methyltransferase [Methanofervidicoccus abyssi]|uniref:16S rRNA (Guanine1207-N2)-methyltransferase n=1 Tax=Methanofervidicoccus abyssi TaxID=2082189 RepID=A0A401HPE5_9EURY|nr:class I SAM-dependent methyltransferase [Methanofervidicoccus abyssi]GBF36147.1 16S rRNA (guanine1207-N2)-methyltransferase [Methanofervidicoccus abyssi]